MELRHLRYFVAVADAGSLTVAAEQKLHTSQPSLSRQIRDLEQEIGVQLMNRSAHGIELTSAGKAFLEHARMALLQAEAAKEAALRAAQPAKPTFALGFLSGVEIGLLPEVNRVLRDEFPGIEIRLSSDYSPALAKALMRRRLDAAFIRPEEHMGELVCRRVRTDPLIFVFPSDHRLASQTAVAPEEIVNETFYFPSKAAPAVRRRFGIFQPCRSRSQAGIRGAQCGPCHLDDHVDARGYAVTGLHQTLSAGVDNHPSGEGGSAHTRPCHRLPQVEQLPDLEAAAFQGGKACRGAVLGRQHGPAGSEALNAPRYRPIQLRRRVNILRGPVSHADDQLGVSRAQYSREERRSR
jgi:DNA-binding transcriptional LysR family regulator